MPALSLKLPLSPAISVGSRAHAAVTELGVQFQQIQIWTENAPIDRKTSIIQTLNFMASCTCNCDYRAIARSRSSPIAIDPAPGPQQQSQKPHSLVPRQTTTKFSTQTPISTVKPTLPVSTLPIEAADLIRTPISRNCTAPVPCTKIGLKTRHHPASS